MRNHFRRAVVHIGVAVVVRQYVQRRCHDNGAYIEVDEAVELCLIESQQDEEMLWRLGGGRRVRWMRVCVSMAWAHTRRRPLVEEPVSGDDGVGKRGEGGWYLAKWVMSLRYIASHIFIFRLLLHNVRCICLSAAHRALQKWGDERRRFLTLSWWTVGRSVGLNTRDKASGGMERWMDGLCGASCKWLRYGERGWSSSHNGSHTSDRHSHSNFTKRSRRRRVNTQTSWHFCEFCLTLRHLTYLAQSRIKRTHKMEETIDLWLKK